MGGGNQGGGSSQEDAEVRNSHTEAGIPAAETRRYFREKENPTTVRNKNVSGNTKSVAHSRDEGGNLIAKQVEYGQGTYAPPQGVRDGDESLAMSQQKTIRKEFIRDNKYLPDQSSLSENLVGQNISRTEKYQAQSDLFKNSTSAEIEAIRAANRKKNPADQDGDGSWLTSTDNMGRVAGIGSRGDGSGSQPYIYDPNLPEGYRGIPQVDPNRGADTNLTMFGKAMRKVGKPVAGALIPGAGALMLLDRFSDKIPSALTGRGTYSPAYDEPIGPNRPSTVAPPTKEFKSYVDSRDLNLGSLGNISPEKNNIGPTSNGTLPAETYTTSNFNRPQLRPTSITASDVGEAKTPTFYDMFGDSKFQTTAERAKMSDVQPNSVFNRIDALKYLEGEPYSENTRNMVDRLYGSRSDQKNLSNQETGSSPSSRYAFTPYDDSGSNANDDPVDNTTTQNTTSDNVASPYLNYTKWTPSEPTYLGTSSYGGKWSTGASGVASTAPTGIYGSGGPSAQVLTDFYNDKTGQYYTAPNAGFYAEAGSNWKRGRPTSSYA